MSNRPLGACEMVTEVIMRRLFIPIAVMTLAAYAQPGGANGLGKPIEIDGESGAEIYVLGADERPADNIYGEQPYGDATGRRIAIRYYPLPNKSGGINILDLQDGSNHEILSGKPPFPAFHAWGEWLYYAQAVEGKKMLRRCNYLTLEVENVTELPPDRGDYSYGTVSPDYRFFSTGSDATTKGNIWSGKVGDEKPTLVHEGKRFGHVSVSRDGKYWIGDTGEKGVPIYIGSFATGRCKRACFSRTEYDGKQWSHAHPYVTADNKWLVFGARRNAHAQAHGAKLKDGWLETL